MTTTIAISNQKGGVAKTTTCLSLGACLAEAGQSVLLIDLDPQAHLTVSLGLKPEQLRRGVDDALLGYTSLVSVSRETEAMDARASPRKPSVPIRNKSSAFCSLLVA